MHEVQVVLYQEGDVRLDLSRIAKGLNRVCSYVCFTSGGSTIHLSGRVISYPETYALLSKRLRDEAVNSYLTIIATKKPYDNNYFFEYSANICILSFFAWDRLTNLPASNGLVYFIAAIIGRKLIGKGYHFHVTGCINDFWADKTEIDNAMRSAFVCDSCASSLEAVGVLDESRDLYNDI